MESETIIAIIGYILAVLFPIIGVIFGLLLYLTKGDDEYIKKHAKYIIIVGIIFVIISIILIMIYGVTSFGFAALS